ncbi:MAG TPA: hypothetical protein DIC59_02840 [Candidatus Competibacteraceae bacterium]|nr:hypothetical protein [Candidatus Competibacteraceae bacterium]
MASFFNRSIFQNDSGFLRAIQRRLPLRRCPVVALGLTLLGSGLSAVAAGPGPQAVAPEAAVELFAPAPATGPQAMRAGHARIGREPVRLNRAIADLPLRAKARFSLPFGVSYELVYDGRQDHPSGNVTWSGYLREYGDDYRAVITFGEEGASGRILTPDGEFLIESDAGGEWLVDPQAAGLKPLEPGDDAVVPLPEGLQMPLLDSKRGAGAVDRGHDARAVPMAADTTSATIDVMILYTPGLASRLGSGLSARLDQLVALSNQAYRDSGIYINLRLVRSQQVNYSDTTTNDAALDALTGGSDPALAGVAGLRDTYGADLVSLVRPFNHSTSGSCGVAWIGGYGGQPISAYANYGYSVIGDGRDVNGSGYYCLDLSFVHELGHNMGSLHDRANSGGGIGAYPYSYGYGVSGTFGTVMSYLSPRIGKFSNPAITCAGGIACGVSETAANSANNALSLNNTRMAVAGFRSAPPPAPSTAYALTVTKSGSGTVTSSPTGINCGTDCGETYAGGTSVTLKAVPASGSTFSGWSGACSGTGSCQIAMSAAKSVTATFTAASTPAQTLITQYYQSILNRAPDAGGLAYWQAEIVRLEGLGVDVSEAFRVMAGQFFTSTEYLAKSASNSQYVTDIYRTFFNRAPDSSGLSYWTNQLAAGLPRSVVLFSFVFSPEFATYMQGLYGAANARAEINAVVDFYRGFFNRLPDSAGFSYWSNRFQAAQCQSAAAVSAEAESISRQFAASAEYSGRNRSSSDYVADLYYGFLRRGGDLAGFNYWVSQLNTKAQTWDQVRRSFLQSPEFQSRVRQIINQGCLN